MKIKRLETTEDVRRKEIGESSSMCDVKKGKQ